MRSRRLGILVWDRNVQLLNAGISAVRDFSTNVDVALQVMIHIAQPEYVEPWFDGGGLGVVYWEPASISSDCRTRWEQGSHWENATLFDFKNAELHEGSDFLGHEYARAEN